MVSLALLSAALLLCLSTSPSLRAAPEVTIYFYNPDANLRDVAKLKTQVQDYFRGIDSTVTLKAFLRLQDLQNALRSQPSDFLIAPSWITKDVGTRYGYKPLLVGKVGADKNYNKVLISKKALPAGGSPSLSTVGLGGNPETLKALVPDLKKYSNVSIVEVSKDIDAVLAVSFDQVDLALVRSQNIDAIRKANESAVTGIKVLAQSAPIEFPNFSASSKVDPPLVDKFLKGLLASKDPKSLQALDLMGFESWGVK